MDLVFFLKKTKYNTMKKNNEWTWRFLLRVREGEEGLFLGGAAARGLLGGLGGDAVEIVLFFIVSATAANSGGNDLGLLLLGELLPGTLGDCVGEGRVVDVLDVVVPHRGRGLFRLLCRCRRPH